MKASSGRTDAREHVSYYGRYSARLTLTTQRLVVRRLLTGGETSYPLSHVTAVGTAKYGSLVQATLLRIDFDDGGAIFFGIYELPAWIQAVEQARAAAPQLPYTAAAPRPWTSGRSGPNWVAVALVALGMLVFCCVTLTALGLILYNLRGG